MPVVAFTERKVPMEVGPAGALALGIAHKSLELADRRTKLVRQCASQHMPGSTIYLGDENWETVFHQIDQFAQPLTASATPSTVKTMSILREVLRGLLGIGVKGPQGGSPISR